MSTLDRHVQEYLTLRRSFGFKLERHERLLAHFVTYCEAAGQDHITRDLAIGWAKLPTTASGNEWAKRLSVVRGFAVYLVTIDPATEVPSTGIFPTNRRRPSPYLFADGDIIRVLAAARELVPPLRAATYEALFGLLAVSGMRIGEAIGLSRDDVDLRTGVITIRHTKFDRTRLVPLHESTAAALSAYAVARDQLCRQPHADVFFCSRTGNPLDRSSVGKVFRKITTTLGLRTATTHPRVHDLRHRFAVHTLVNWQRQQVSIDTHLPVLSGYLGHVAPSDTYWYLSAVPELMTLAADRLEVRFGGR